ncbi:hypothetical protein J7L29_07930 [Candidatus Bathyarchaeota archaeon]|nr:hypothetical protein [Candidatus Bathyarchaeota archaeon]
MKIGGEKRIGVSNILSALYFLSGAILLASMSLVGGLPIHLALVGVLNISTSYSLTRMRRLSFYIAVINSLVSLVFGCSSLIALILLLSQNTAEALMLAGFIGYIAISIATLIYVTSKRKMFLQK